MKRVTMGVGYILLGVLGGGVRKSLRPHFPGFFGPLFKAQCFKIPFLKNPLVMAMVPGMICLVPGRSGPRALGQLFKTVLFKEVLDRGGLYEH